MLGRIVSLRLSNGGSKCSFSSETSKEGKKSDGEEMIVRFVNACCLRYGDRRSESDGFDRWTKFVSFSCQKISTQGKHSIKVALNKRNLNDRLIRIFLKETHTVQPHEVLSNHRLSTI